MSLRRVAAGLASVLALAMSPAPAAAQPAPDVVLRGVLTRADHQTYRELGFRAPPGVSRLTVDFSYTGKDQHATIDLGLFDPQRFRGWSGGAKASFTLSATDATPSYLPGPILAGRWRLILGVPNIRAGTRAEYVARIRFGRGEAPAVSTYSDKPLRGGPGWYRGDLHMHTAHSDGSCASQSGAQVPCPVFRTLEAAAARGLDFVVVSDHNTVSQDQSLRELQPFFDRLLLIGGEEVTTFHGHAGVIGAVGFVDFRLGGRAVPTMAALLEGAEKAHGLVVINHPALASGESCMGCGWTAADTPYSRIQAVEVVNGGVLGAQGGFADGPFSGIPFWEARLNAGDRLTAVGGSDNHRPDTPAAAAVGSPTTVVHAANLSERAVLDAIRDGHVFIDVESTPGRLLELTASAGSERAQMGDLLSIRSGEVRFEAHAQGVKGGRWRVTEDGQRRAVLDASPIDADDSRASFSVSIDRRPHWVRVDVTAADGRRTLLIGNPIYLPRNAPTD
jgi:hypothetical protein